jgi:RimJ/RimL family protein N-acetyltransferase/predicted nucleic acid-binding protein
VIVVSDSSPLITLSRVHQLELLREFYGRVSIPREVYEEVTVAGAGLPGAEEVRRAAWIQVQANPLEAPAKLRAACSGLGLGERSAILLARALSADVILIDKARARRIAKGAGLDVAGSIAILERGTRLTKVADLRSVYLSLLHQGIRFDRRLLDQSLASEAGALMQGTMETWRACFLKTERLGFSRWESSDFDLARGLWGDTEVTRLIGGPFTDEQIRERLGCEIASMHEHGVQYWPVFLLESGEHTGCAGLRSYRAEDEVYELGFHFRRAYWGRGLAVEAGRAVVAFAFESLGAKALFAGHHPENRASRRVLEKLGFQFTHEEFYVPSGVMHRSYLLKRVEIAFTRV